MQKVLKDRYGNYQWYKSGKVKEIYRNEFDGTLASIASDRISAFDRRVGDVPDKGKILTSISAFWSEWIDNDKTTPYYTAFLGSNAPSVDEEYIFYPFDEFDEYPELAGRITYMADLDMFPINCVIRGHITGSTWKFYEHGVREICGVRLPEGLRNGDPFPDGPIFTPTAKTINGYDENITFSDMAYIIREKHMGTINTAERIRECCIDLYDRAYNFAFKRGIIIADTKFKLGLDYDGLIVFGSEILTPDSSCFWDADRFEIGKEQPPYEKQIIRNYIARNNIKDIPISVVQETRKRYIKCYEKITGLNWIE